MSLGDRLYDRLGIDVANQPCSKERQKWIVIVRKIMKNAKRKDCSVSVMQEHLHTAVDDWRLTEYQKLFHSGKSARPNIIKHKPNYGEQENATKER